MRALIVTTCIALLAAVGHYFWSEYNNDAANAAAAFATQQQKLLAAFEEREAIHKQQVADEIAHLEMTLAEHFPTKAADRNQIRVEQIDAKACGQALIDVVWVASMRPIRDSTDLWEGLRHDLRDCAAGGMFTAADMKKIHATGVDTILSLSR